MQKRDIFVLLIAVTCGVFAFILVINLLKRPMASQSPVTSTAAKVQPASISIPNGMSLLVLSSNEIDNLPDLIVAGSYVDIIGIAPNYAEKMELQTIVRGAQVTKLEDKKEEPGVKSIMVALSPAGAEVVSKALTQGKLRLTLRPDNGEKGVLQNSSPGFIEVIRGVEKEKVMQHAEK